MNGIPILGGHRVLVVCLDAFGDIVLREPLLRWLCARDCMVHVLVRDGYQEILPYINTKLMAMCSPLDPFQLPGADAPLQVAKLGEMIHSLDPHLIIAAAYERTLVESWCLLCSPHAHAAGFDIDDYDSLNAQHSWSHILTEVPQRDDTRRTLVSVPRTMPEVEKNAALLKAISGETTTDRPRLNINDCDRCVAASELALRGLEAKDFIVGCPAVASVVAKSMPPSLFAEAISQALKQRSERLLLIGHENERIEILRVAEECQSRGIGVSTWFGDRRTLGTLLGLLESAKLYVGTDTGTMHFAAALGVPIAAVFGGGHWPRFLPDAQVSHVCTRALPCFGCGWQCWFEQPHCITSVSAEQLAHAIEGLLFAAERSEQSLYRLIEESLPPASLAMTMLAEAGFKPGDDRVPTAFESQFERERAAVVSNLQALALRTDVLENSATAKSRSTWRGLRSLGNEPLSIDVVVPSFNQGQFLRQALDSILEQNHPGVSVFVMDGGSTDETEAILHEYTTRLRCWRMRADDGQASAIAEGVSLGTGRIVAWLNSDDFYLPGAFERVAQAFERHPSRGLYIGNGFRFAQADGTIQPFCTRHLALNRRALAEGLDYVLQPSTFFLRAAWEDVGGIETQLQYGLDWDLILRIAARWPAVLINEFLAASREWSSTKTASGGSERVEELIRISRHHTGMSLTKGALYYAIETALADAQDAVSEPTRAKLFEVMGSLRNEFASAYGNSDGFPEFGDSQDVVDLPLVVSSAPAEPVSNDLPSISLVMPSFEQAAFLSRAIHSVLNQHYAKLQMLVFDGGSRDGSVNILEGFSSGLSRWVSEPDRGPAHAINKGFREASGDILCWLNSDDMLAEDALLHVARAFAEDPSVDVVYGNALYLDENDALTCPDHGGYRTGLYYGRFQPADRIPYYWEYVHSVPQPAVFFRRNMLDRVGLLDESYHFVFDFVFFARFASSGAKIRKLERTLAFYRLHTSAKTSNWNAFLEELYRYSRPRWPAVRKKAFRRVLRSFLRRFGTLQFGQRPWSWHRRALLFVAGAMVTLRLGNPERVFPQVRTRLRNVWAKMRLGHS